ILFFFFFFFSSRRRHTRFSRDWSSDVCSSDLDDEKIGDILIPIESGHKIPLREIATISYITGPTFIYRDGSSRYIAIGFSVEGRSEERRVGKECRSRWSEDA